MLEKQGNVRYRAVFGLTALTAASGINQPFASRAVINADIARTEPLRPFHPLTEGC